jgi:phage shock protein B
MDDTLVPIAIVATLFIGFPWLILHYLTQWKRNKGLSVEDETLLDDLHETARRLDARLDSIERIMTADHPGWKDGR